VEITAKDGEAEQRSLRPISPERVLVIGFGAIGAEIARGLAAVPDAALIGVLIRRPLAKPDVMAAVPADVWVGTIASEAVDLAPTLVVECAGHAAVPGLGTFLAAGADVLVTSTGGLVDSEIRARVLASARSGGGRIRLSAGAIAGIDGLAALALGRLDEVCYTSSKPPVAWKGTRADSLLDLDVCREPAVFFEGSAAEAATQFPKNANIAATVAFAGLGLDRTRVRLVADPALRENVGQLVASGAIDTLEVRVQSPASSNPRTSAITAFSVLSEIRSGTSAVTL
jgi:aspartate dehydrogenase